MTEVRIPCPLGELPAYVATPQTSGLRITFFATDRRSAMQSQCRALQRDVGLFLDRFWDFDSDAGLRNVDGASVDEFIPGGAIIPSDRGRR